MKKRALSLLLAIAMLVTMVPTYAMAETLPEIYIDTSNVGALKAGDEFSVPVKVKNNPGLCIAYLEFDIPSVFTFKSITNDSNAATCTYSDIEQLTVAWEYSADFDADYTGETLYTLTFIVNADAAPGTYKIGVELLDDISSNLGNVDDDVVANFTAGTVAIAGEEETAKAGFNNGGQYLTYAEVKADNYTLTVPGEGYYFAGWFTGLDAAGITANEDGYYVLSAGTASGTEFAISECRPKYDAAPAEDAVYHALWVYDDASTFRSMVLTVMDAGNVVFYSKSTDDNNQITANNTTLLNETIQTVAGAGRIKLIKDMASLKLSNYKAVEETYIAPAIRMDMNGCTLTMTAENGECFAIHTRTENNLTQCIESSRGKGKITGGGGIVLDVENDTVMELRDLQITAADGYAIQLGVGTNLAKVERCDITLQSGSGAAIYVLGNSTYPATVGVIDGCTINSTGYLIQIDQKASTVGPISNTTMTGTGTYAIGGNGTTSSKRKGTVTFGAGNNIQATKASMLLTVQGAHFTVADGTYQAVGSIYSSSATVTGPSGYALKNNATLSFVPAYEVHFYSHDGSELLETQALDKGVSPTDPGVTYPDVGLNGYDHVGWTLTPGGTELVDLSTITTETTNLYAVRVAVTREVAAEVTVNGQTKQYASFADALAAKGTDYQDAEGEHITIKLLKDATSTAALAFSNASLTLDLNGHTLEFINVTKVFTDKGTAAGRKLTITSTANAKGNLVYYYQMALVNSSNPADIEFSNLNISCTGYAGMYGDILSVSAPAGEIQRTAQYTFKNCQSTGLSAVSITGQASTIPTVVRFENCQMDLGTYPIVSYSKTDYAVVVYVDTNSRLKTTFMMDGSAFKGAAATVPAGYVFADSDGDGWYMAERVKVEIEGSTGTEDAPEVEMTEEETSVEINNAEGLTHLESLTVTSNENVVLKFLSDALDSIGNLVTGNASISIETNPNKTNDTTLVRYDLNVTNGEGEKVSFNGDVEIKIPFTPVAGIDASKYCAYHIDDEGNRQAVKTIVTGDESTGFFASFTIPHFSSVEIDRVADQYTAGLTTITTEVPTGGESVTIYVGVTHNNADQTSFNAAEIVITYDPAMLVLDTSVLDELKAAGKLDYTNANGVLTIAQYGEDKLFGTDVYTLLFKTADTVAEPGETVVTITRASFINKENAKAEDLQDAVLDIQSVTISVIIQTYDVELPTDPDVTGSTEAEHGSDYEFAIQEEQYYEYTVNAMVNGVEVPVTDLGNGQYVIDGEYVTGDIVITYEKTPMSFDLTFTDADGNEQVTNNGVTYNEDYSFTLPTKDQWQYSYEIFIDGVKFENASVADDGVTVTIPGQYITNDIEINIVGEQTEFNITLVGPDASVSDSDDEGNSFNKGETVTITVTPTPGYVYAVNAVKTGTEETVALTQNGYVWTVENLSCDLTVTVTKSLVGTVKYYEYLTLDGDLTDSASSYVTLVTYTDEDLTTGYIPYCNGQAMFWSEKYDAYCYLVIDESVAKAEDATVISVASGEHRVISYTMNINSSSKIDAADAQLIYNMYMAEYATLEEVGIMKFLFADVNGDYLVDLTDANAIISAILNGSAN